MPDNADFEVYDFGVTIFKDDEGKWSYSICQDFESESGDDFQILEQGQGDTLDESVTLVSEGVKRIFA